MGGARAVAALCAAAAVVCGGAASAITPPQPPPTGDPALSAKVDAALGGAKTYHIAVQAAGGLTLDISSAGSDRMKIGSRSPGNSAESIVVGTSLYYRSGGGEWKAYPIPPLKQLRRNRLYMGAPDTLLQPLADRDDGGATVGAFRSIATGNGQLPGLMECTYDKATYRPRSCNVTLQGIPEVVRVTYAGWDDPANAVEPPPGVAAATPPPRTKS
jgi:hypothetical protein